MCPGVTDTEMTKHIIGAFKDQDLYWQPPEAVGDIIVAIEADPSIVGKAYYIEGGDGWEYEDTFYQTQPQWLSEEGCRRMRVNAEAVQRVRRLSTPYLVVILLMLEVYEGRSATKRLIFNMSSCFSRHLIGRLNHTYQLRHYRIKYCIRNC